MESKIPHEEFDELNDLIGRYTDSFNESLHSIQDTLMDFGAMIKRSNLSTEQKELLLGHYRKIISPNWHDFTKETLSA